jgi:hypothetical protein
VRRFSDYRHFALIGLALFAGMYYQQIGLLDHQCDHPGFLANVVFTPALAVPLYRASQTQSSGQRRSQHSIAGFFCSGGDLSLLVTGDVLTIISAGFWLVVVVPLSVDSLPKQAGR